MTTRINSQEPLSGLFERRQSASNDMTKRGRFEKGPHSKPPKIAFTIVGPPKTPTKQLHVWEIQDLCKSCSIDESDRELVVHSRALGDTPLPIN
ncbi:hypothetical protein CEXT_229311 [Caerostris extrusa]|uniref:Uncharacterized protein n=1 Tax=Caerostris extrusa TaxID=172846 RepID=A0AAV4NPJ4_CAEEX|nr:hypothetical protein CEXT_229311 [Caerostris extrusa]